MRSVKTYRKEVRGKVIRGVCLGWDFKPHLSFEDGYLFGDSERIFYPEYFPNNEEWPIDPETKEKLPIHYI